jgi:hypothetical protein
MLVHNNPSLYTLHLKTKKKTQHRKKHNPANNDIYEQKCATYDTASKNKQKLVLWSPCREDFQNTKQINKLTIKHIQNNQIKHIHSLSRSRMTSLWLALADQQRPMTMTENEKRQEGPGTISISSKEEDPEPWTYSEKCKVSTLFQEGQVTDAGCQ